MIYNLYVIYDKVAGVYLNPFQMINDSIAIRAFKTQCKNMGADSTDYELYKLGTMDIQSGFIAVLSNPELLCKGEVVE